MWIRFCLMFCIGFVLQIDAKQDVVLYWSEQYAAAEKLVDISTISPTIVLDLRYATTNNFTDQKVYETHKCYLHKDVAIALNRVQEYLATIGLGLKIWDGYRPLWSQQMLWNIVPDERYVACPSKGGVHTRCVAVDLTLVHLQDLQELEMPTLFDDFSEKAHRDYENITTEQRSNRQLLEDVMVTVGGFEGHSYEWWHFNFHGWENYTPLNIGLSQLELRDMIVYTFKLKN